MTEEVISEIIDRAQIAGDKDYLLSALKEIFDVQTKLAGFRIELKGASSIKDVTAAATGGARSVDLLSKSTERLKFAISDENIQLQANNALIKDANNAAKVLAKQQSGANTAYEEQAQRLIKVKQELKNLVAAGQESGDTYERLRKEFTELDTVIRKADKSVGDFSRNVGNYEGSAKIIVDALEKEKKKLEELEKARIRVQNAGGSFNPGSGNIAATRTTITGFAGGNQVAPVLNNIASNAGTADKAIELLNEEIEKSRTVVEGFQRITDNDKFFNLGTKTLDATTELKFFTRALIDLERQGRGNSKEATELRNRLAELTGQVGGAKAEIKALSSDTRGFDLFAGSITFAADAFQTFAGAAVLAGASEEDAAEATKTLVAVQSVANGIKGIANELTTRGTAANKLYAFAQLQVTTATNGSAAASARFAAGLRLLTGIGIIAILGYLITNFSKVKEVLGFTSKAQEAYNETLQDFKKGATEAIEKTDKVKLAFDQAKAGVIGKDEALRIYNETLGDTFGKATSLAEAERLYNEKAGAYIEIMALKAQANALFAKSADEAAKGIVASNEDQIGFFDKLKAGVKFNLGFTENAISDLTEAQKKGAEEAQQLAKQNELAFKAKGTELATKAELLAKGLNINIDPTKTDKPAKTKADDSALKDAVEAEKRKAAALKAIAIENANEIIRINQAVIDNDNSSLKDKIIAIEAVSQARKDIAAIELADAVKNEQKVEQVKGKAAIVEIKKTQLEIEAATVGFNNKVNAINDESLKSQQDAQKANTEKITAEIEKEREAKLQALDISAQAERDRLKKENNEAITSLNERYLQGKISQEEYANERKRIELGYYAESLEAEIAYQKTLIELSDLPADKKAEALRRLSDLELELNDLSIQSTKDAEAEKLAAIEKTYNRISEISGKAFEFITGALNANAEAQKNKLKDQETEAEKKAAADIDRINASALTEEEKGERIKVVNARLAAQKQQLAEREKQINIQQARFEKAKAIFTITLNTVRAIAEAAPNPFKIALAAAMGAAQLAIAVATPLPKYYKGKNVINGGDKYEGLATVNEYRDEVIKRTDGTVEYPKGRNVLTWLGANDQVFPSLDSYLDSLLKSTHNDAMAFSGGVPVIIQAPQDNSEQRKTNQLLQRLVSKQSTSVVIYDNGHSKYEIEQSNWK